jgi:hypothetical protein
MGKRRWLWSVLLIVALIMSGCGGSGDDADVDVDVNESDDQVTIETDSSEVTVSTDASKSVAIPDGYPEDAIPIYDDLFLSAASKSDDGSYVIIGMTNDSIPDIADFYEKIFANADVMMLNSSEDQYMNMGDLNGITYTISANPGLEELGYKNSLNIIVLPSFDMSDESDDEESDAEETDSEQSEATEDEEAVFIEPSGVSLPADYPADVMPIMEEESGELAIVQDAGGKKLVGYMTKSLFDDVYDYYDEIFMDAENFTMEYQGPSTFFKGMIDGVMYEVDITENTPDTGQNPDYNTLIRIFYY